MATIAEELQDLQTNLQAAKTAVTTKGGTVGDTGLAGLATEIASIPSGGSPSDETDYGVVYYYDFPFVTSAEGENCTVTIEDQTTFDNFLLANSVSGEWYLEFAFEPGTGWTTETTSGQQTFTTSELLATVGLSVTDFDESSADALIYASGGYEGDPETLPQIRKVLNSVDEFNSLVAGSEEPVVRPEHIAKFVFGTRITSIPDNFLNGATNLKTVITDYATNITTIGNNVLQMCDSLEFSIIKFDEVTTIGDGFCSEMNFKGIVNLPKVKTIGSSCFTSNTNLPIMPEVENIGNNFMERGQCAQCNLNEYPMLKTLGTNAFNNAYITDFSCTLPSSLTSIGAGLCMNCNSLGKVTVNTNTINKIQNDSSSNYSFASSTRGLSYRGGIEISGSSTIKNALIAKFPNSDQAGHYRKWVS